MPEDATRVQRALFRLAGMLASRGYFRGRDRITAKLLVIAQRIGPVVIVVDGHRLALDLRDGMSVALWRTRTLPGSTWTHLQSLCRPGDVVIDVGANLGYMALVAARAVGPDGRVLAIEPAARSYRLLVQNGLQNYGERITTIRAACGEDDGTATITVSDDSEEYSSLSAAVMPGRAHQERVPMRSLASICDEFDIAPSVVKIDVEGAEWAVLKGLLPGVKPRALIVEFSLSSRHFGYRASEMCSWLQAAGYHLTLVGASGTQDYDPRLADQIALGDVLATRLA